VHAPTLWFAGLGRCKAAFNPKTSLSELAQRDASSRVELDEVNCMNMWVMLPNLCVIQQRALLS